MKLTARNSAEFLNAPDGSGMLGALVYGPDSGQALAHSRTIIAKILGAHNEPTALIELDDARLKSDPAILADECGAMSLLGGRRLVWLRDISDKHAALIGQCVPLLGHDCYLLVTGGDLGARDKLRALFEPHKQLAALACYRLEGNQLAAHIRSTLQAQGFRVDRNVVDTLTRELGNDQMVTARELEKLSLYALGKSDITMQDIEAVVLHNDEHKMDALCQFFADKHIREFEALWHQLMRDHEPPVMLVRALLRYMHRLLELKLKMQQEGVSAEQVVDNARPPIFFRAKPVMTRQLSRLRSGDILTMIHIINQAELAIKSSSQPPAMMAFATLSQAVR